MSQLLYLVYVFSGILFITDQFTKFLAREYLFQQSFVFGWLRFDLVFNTGAAYGMFSTFTSFLTWLGVFVIAYLLYSLKSLIHTKLDIVAYSFIIAGAFGNTVDRMLFGKVTDFINIQIIPVFNFADIYLNIGVLLILINTFFYGKKSS